MTVFRKEFDSVVDLNAFLEKNPQHKCINIETRHDSYYLNVWFTQEERKTENTPFKYKDIEAAAKQKYPEDVWKRVAFKNGSLWAIEHLFPEKNRDELFDEMEIPRITLD